MPNLTIYVREDDMELFDRARKQTDEKSLSQVITKAIREYLERKQKLGVFDETEGMKEIVLKVNNFLSRKVMFIGKHIYTPSPEHCPDGESIDQDWFGFKREEDWNEEQVAEGWNKRVWSLYKTKKGKFLWYVRYPDPMYVNSEIIRSLESKGITPPEPSHTHNGTWTDGANYYVYDSFDDFIKDSEIDLVLEVDEYRTLCYLIGDDAIEYLDI